MSMDGYLQFVMQTANEQQKVFIMDTGEGNDLTDPVTGWYIEDFSGWLIEPPQEEDLIKAIHSGAQYTLFKNEYVFAKWHRDDTGKISVKFVRY